jgi:hypothetical protein
MPTAISKGKPAVFTPDVSSVMGIYASLCGLTVPMSLGPHAISRFLGLALLKLHRDWTRRVIGQFQRHGLVHSKPNLAGMIYRVLSLLVVSFRKYTFECASWLTFSDRLHVFIARILFPFQSHSTCVDNSSRLSHLTQHTSPGRSPATQKAYFTSASFVSPLNHNCHFIFRFRKRLENAAFHGPTGSPIAVPDPISLY